MTFCWYKRDCASNPFTKLHPLPRIRLLGRRQQGVTDRGASTPETDFLTVRRLAIRDQGAGGAGSSEASLLGLQTAVLTWFSLLCVCVLLPLLIRTLVLLNWSQDMTLFELNCLFKDAFSKCSHILGGREHVDSIQHNSACNPFCADPETSRC